MARHIWDTNEMSSSGGLQVMTGLLDSEAVAMDVWGTNQILHSEEKQKTAELFVPTAISSLSRKAVPPEQISSRTQNDKSTKEPARYPCFMCTKRFTRSSTLRDHERAHNNDRPFNCNSCSKSFARLKDRERHRKLHAEEKHFGCRGSFNGSLWGCGRKFAREDGLVAHFRSVNGTNCWSLVLGHPLIGQRGSNGRYTCSLSRTRDSIGCGQSFNSSSEVIEHFQSSLGMLCRKNIAVERARRDAQKFREESEKQARNVEQITSELEHLEDAVVIGFSPAHGIKGTNSVARVESSTIWKAWDLQDVQFGDVTTTDFSWYPMYLPTTRKVYAISIKVPPTPNSRDAPSSVSVKLRVNNRLHPTMALKIVNLGTFTYDDILQDSVPTSKSFLREDSTEEESTDP